jgi:CheY-like chemotaxis protein/chemotaxis signal transduction protein
MSTEHLLLVDDSDAILAFEGGVLSPYYTVTTASTGREALAAMRRATPDCVLLDLSMPEMDGETVLARMRADDKLVDVPVVVVSSEASRAQTLVGRLADAYVPKPIPADLLLRTVSRVLTERREARRKRGLACLVVTVGEHVFALPLESVAQVLPELATEPLPAGPPYVREAFVLEGAPVLVVDLASVLGVTSTVTRLDRMLVVARFAGRPLAFRVDRVADPEDVPSDDVIPFDALPGARDVLAHAAIRSFVRRGDRHVPVLEATALVGEGTLASLAGLLDDAARAVGGAP